MSVGEEKKKKKCFWFLSHEWSPWEDFQAEYSRFFRGEHVGTEVREHQRRHCKVCNMKQVRDV